ncbi:unnamed protein product [Schistocephalus solidus]|uniref:J domain-containing protein n=2 Tax=Schistocephalus solidus TaxID=70667 RepID=A0A183T8V4_SCHSO|nr:unnamed protein product [Schistocephalus solidus]
MALGLSLAARRAGTLRLSFIPKLCFSTSTSKGENLYKVLGLSHEATQREIKEAFYSLSKLYHPDRSSSSESSKKFKEISGAYEILGDPVRRMDYDRGLVIPKHRNEESSSFDANVLRKYSDISFTPQYAGSYNKHLHDMWRERADISLSKSAFDYRLDQRSFVVVFYITTFGAILGAYLLTKYYEEPIPLIQHSET